MLAINLNGTGSFRISGVPAYGNRFTVDLWVKLNSLTQRNFSSLFMRGTGTTANGVHIYTDTIAVRRAAASGLGSPLERISNLSVDRWYRLTFVCDGEFFKYFRDGVFISSVMVEGPFSTKTELSIGDFSAGYGSQLDGAIHDFKIFNRDLSDSEVLELYNTRSYSSEFDSNIVLQLKLNNISDLEGATLVGSVVEDVFNEYVTNKTLILSNGEYKTWDATNGVWVTVSTTLPSAEQFIESGLDSLSPLLDRVNGVSPLDNLTGDFEVLTWTDEINSAREIKLSVSQTPQLIYPTSDISLAGVETVDKITLTATGNAKVAVSFDSGLTWEAYRNGAWETVPDAFSGMTTNEINALTNVQIAEGRGDSEFIRFSYSLSDDAEIDKIEIRVTLQGTERILPTDAYDLDYDEQTKTIIYTLKRDMTLSVNYVDG